MKNILLSLFFLTCFVDFSNAQWTTNSSNTITSTSSSVGIGTTSPASKLEINGDVNVYPVSNYTSAGAARQLTIGEVSNNSMYRLALGYYQGPTGVYTGVIQSTHGGTGNNLILNPTGGNVGFGTATPSSALQIGDFNTGSSNNQVVIPGTYNFEQLRLGQTGNGNAALEVVNHTNASSSYGIKMLINADTGFPGLQFQYAPITTAYTSLSYTTGLCMDLSGNVAIGTTNAHNYKLAVNGAAIATSMTVMLNSAWPDYVFKQPYHLPALTAVKAYIEKNKHLPELPSAESVEKDGINLGEINKLLTKKVEELTLYLIEKDKQIHEANEKNKQLGNRVSDLEKRLIALEKKMK